MGITGAVHARNRKVACSTFNFPVCNSFQHHFIDIKKKNNRSTMKDKKKEDQIKNYLGKSK